MTSKKNELKIEQGGLVAQLKDNLTKNQRIRIRERLAEIDKELTALHEEHNRFYLLVRGYDAKTKQFDLRKSSTPLKSDRYFVVEQKYTWRLENDKLERVPCKQKMYQLESAGKLFYLQSKDERLLRLYVAHLDIEGVEVVQKWSKEAQRIQDKEEWAHDGDKVKPLTRIPRSGTWTLEGRRVS